MQHHKAREEGTAAMAMRPGTGPRSAPAASEGIRKSLQARILVVDDSADMRDTLCDILDMMGHKTASAGDGVEALERFRSGEFDVVVSDFHMPRMDGLQLLREIKASRPEVPVILAFGGDDEEFRAVKEAGAFAAMRKPYDADALDAVIKRALAHLP